MPNSHLENAIQLIVEPEEFNIHGYLSDELAKFDYRDPLAWIFHQGKYDKAIKKLELALAENPDSRDANEYMANLLVTLGKYQESITYYQKIIQRDKSTPDHLNLAVVYEHLGDRPKTIDHYRWAAHNTELSILSAFLLAFPEKELRPQIPEILDQIRNWLNQELDKEIPGENDKLTESPFELIKKKFLKPPLCPICQSRDTYLFYSDIPNHRQIRDCRKCKLIFVSPQPNLIEIQSWYGDRYFEPSLEGAKKQLDLWKEALVTGKNDFHPTGKQFSLIFQWLESLGLKEIESKAGHSLRLLDIGCATGGLMAEFISRGWEAKGVELSESAVQFDRKMGFEVIRGTLEEAKYPDRYFDFITMTHVIEHLSGPVRSIREITRILKKGGRLFIRTPNAESLPRLIAGKEWFGDHDHLYFFGNRSLITLLENHNFAILGIKSYTGIDIETYRKKWDEYRLNDLIRARINQADLGDVILVYAEYKG